MTPQYTATARMVIDPPAGADLRSAMAVSPIYLESLKTYEHFADSDSLFQKAVQQFGLARRLHRIAQAARAAGADGAQHAHPGDLGHVAGCRRRRRRWPKFLAESTVEMNRASVSESDQELLRGIEQQARELRARLQETDATWAKAVAAEPLLGLQSAMEQAAELRVQDRGAGAERGTGDRRSRRARQDAPPTPPNWRKQESNARARLAEMRKQLQDVDRQGAEREKLLATRQAHRDQLDAERKAGQAALAAMEARLRDARGETGFRGERLKIIDPGIVPERPSSPNLPLNVAAALLAGLVLPILYLTLEMSFQEARRADAQQLPRGSKARDE